MDGLGVVRELIKLLLVIRWMGLSKLIKKETLASLSLFQHVHLLARIFFDFLRLI